MSKKDEVGEQAWFYTWAQDEGSFDTRTFTRETIEAAKTEDFRLGEVPSPVTDVYIGVDPAVAASGHCAIIGWGLDRRTKQRYLLSVFNETGLRTWGNVIDAIAATAVRLKSQGATLRSVVIEQTNVQASLIQDERLTRLIRGMGARVVTFRTRTGSGAQARLDSFNITTIGGLFDAGLISLPYGGTVQARELVDAYVEQFLSWRVDDEGRSIKHLKRDMVMACLFAESEAFKEANRVRDRKPRPRPIMPAFVEQSYREERRWRHDQDVAAFVERVDAQDRHLTYAQTVTDKQIARLKARKRREPPDPLTG